MNTSQILRISLIISILGIILLSLLSNFLNPEPILIKDINNKMINKKVLLKGEVIEMKNFQNYQIITLADNTSQINIFLDKKLNLNKNQSIKVLGAVKEYKNGYEIYPDKIILSPN